MDLDRTLNGGGWLKFGWVGNPFQKSEMLLQVGGRRVGYWGAKAGGWDDIQICVLYTYEEDYISQ